MHLYYQPTDHPSHHLLGLYMPGGNRKKLSGYKLPGRVEKNGKLYLITRDPKNRKERILKEIK
jgi:hypothetical protein